MEGHHNTRSANPGTQSFSHARCLPADGEQSLARAGVGWILVDARTLIADVPGRRVGERAEGPAPLLQGEDGFDASDLAQHLEGWDLRVDGCDTHVHAAIKSRSTTIKLGKSNSADCGVRGMNEWVSCVYTWQGGCVCCAGGLSARVHSAHAADRWCKTGRELRAAAYHRELE